MALEVPGAEGDEPTETQAPAKPKSYPFWDAFQEAKRREATNTARLETQVRDSRDIPPEKAARVLKMQFRTGMDRDIIHDHLDEFEKDAEAAGIDAPTFWRKSPKVARWFSESPYHMSVGRADLAGLQDVERLFSRKDDPMRPLSDAEVEAEVDADVRRIFPAGGISREKLRRIREDYGVRPGEGLEEAERALDLKTHLEDRGEKDMRAKILAERQAEERYIAETEGIGFWEAGARRAKENPAFLVPFLAGAVDTARHLTLYEAASAIEEGTASPEQVSLVRRFGRLAMAAERRGTNVRGTVAEILAGLPAVGVEFVGTGGVFRGAKVAVEQTLRKATERAIHGLARKAVGTAAGSAAQSLAMGATRLPGAIAERMLPGIQVTADQAGQMQAVLDPEAADDFGAALLKAAGTEYVQAVTERMGGGVEKLAARLKPAFIKRWVAAHPAEGVEGFLAKVKSSAGWNGILGEMFEERAAEVLQAPIDGYHRPTAEQLAAEAMAFAAPSLLGVASLGISALKVRGQRAPAEDVQKAKQEAVQDKALLQGLGDAVKEWKLSKMAPELAEDAVRSMAPGAPHLYADARRFAAYWEGKKDEKGQAILPMDVADRLGVDPREYERAVQDGGVIKIPTEKYAVQIAPTEHGAFFQDELTTDPLRQSYRETQEMLSQMEKEQVETAAAERLSEPNVTRLAKQLARKEAVEALKVTEKNDIIAQVREVSPRIYWQTESGKGAEELVQSGIPAELIADPAKAQKLGRTYAATVDEVAERFGMSPGELVQAVAEASQAREKARARVESEEIPEHILEAAADEEFRREVRKGADEALHEKALAATAEKKRVGKWIAKSAKEFGEGVRRGLVEAGSGRDAAAYAKIAEVMYRRAAERSDIVSIEKLFRQFGLEIRRQEAPVETAADVLRQPEAEPGKLGRFDVDLDSPIHVVKVDPVPDSGIPQEMKDAAKEFYKSEIRGRAIEHPVLGEVQFYREGIGKTLAYSAGMNRHRLAVIRALPEVVRNSVPYIREPDIDSKERRDFVQAVGAVEIEGVPYAVRVVLRENHGRGKGKGERSYYTFYGYSLGEMGGSSPGATLSEPAAAAATPGQVLADLAAPSSGSDQSTPASKPTPTVRQALDAVKGRRLFHAAESGSPRGQLRIGPNLKMDLDLFAGADRSTALHEFGHLYLELLQQLDKLPSAQADVRADFNSVLKWFGLTREQWAGMDFEAKRQYHEQFARGFERYLMEGKAPSKELRGVFWRFKKWLTDLYRELLNLNVELSPEIRAVFDRMLATEDEITDARAEEGILPLFENAKEAGMTDAEAAAYARHQSEIEQEAEERLTERMMEDLRKEDEEWWEQEAESRRRRIWAELDASPLYTAISVIRTGKLPDGTEYPAGRLKLDRAAARRMLPKAPEKFLEDYTIVKSGQHPDLVAGLFGFPSGERMLSEIAEAKSRETLVDEQVAEEMSREFGNPPGEAERRRLAVEALHGDGYEEALELEARAIAKQAAAAQRNVGAVLPRVPQAAFLRDQAAQGVARMKVEEIDPRMYQMAERRAGREAVAAWKKGDHAGALEAKTRQAVNAAYYRAAYKAKNVVNETIRDWTKKLRDRDTEKLAKRRDMDLVNAARAIVRRVNGTPSPDGKPASAYLADIEKYDPDTYSALKAIVEDAGGNDRTYSQLTFEEFVRVKDAVDALWDLSLRTRQFEVEGKRVDLENVVSALGARLNDITPAGASSARHGAVTNLDRAWSRLLGFVAAGRRVESWVDLADGGNPDGPFRKYIWRGVSEGADQARALRGKLNRELAEIVKTIEKDFTSDKIDAPELNDYTFGNAGSGMAELLGAMLHIGNPSNYQKMIRGNKWGDYDAEGNLDDGAWKRFIARMEREGRIRKEHYDFLQKVWDLMEAQKPGIWKAHKEMYGFYPDEVSAATVNTPFGDYRGGYVPAIVDPEKSADASIREEKALLERTDNSWALPTTGKGATMKRSERYAAPLMMDVRYLRRHLDWVARFQHIEPRIKDVARLLRNGDLRPQLEKYDKAALSDMLPHWLQRAAAQRVETPMKGEAGKGFGWMLSKIRKNTGIVYMAGNAMNAAQNLAGLFLSAVKVSPGHLAGGLLRYVTSPNVTAEKIHELSTFMKSRADTELAAVIGDMDAILLNAGPVAKAKEWVDRHAMILQRVTQSVVDNATWLGAFDEAVAKGRSQEEAVRDADSVVRQTQGSGAAEDVSRYETGTPLARIFTQFQSYFNTWGNLLFSEVQKMRGVPLKEKYQRLAAIYVTGILIPTAVAAAIRVMFKGLPDDKDRDGHLDEMAQLLAVEQFSSLAGMAPLAGPAVRASFSDRDTIGAAPAFSAYERVADSWKVVGRLASDNPRVKKSKAVADAISILGLLTGLPTGFASRPISLLMEQSEKR